VAHNGSDDWRNGIPLCSTHHDAFDDYLFRIDPKSKKIECRPGVLAAEVGLRESSLNTLKNTPHEEALNWRWETTCKEWNAPPLE
jgi:putative restriction endonuclease